MTEEIEEQAAELEQERQIAVRVMPATITADFAPVEEKVKAIVEPYEDISAKDIEKMSLDDMRKERAYLNGVHKELNAAKIAVKKEYEAPYKAFEEQVKRLLKMVDEPNETIKACISDKERHIKNERREQLKGVFLSFLADNGLPNLAQVLDFDRVCDPDWWDTTAKGWTVKKHEGELCDRIASVLAEWRSLQGVRSKLYDPAYAEGVFWETLKAAEAINADIAENDRRSAIAAARRDLGAEGEKPEPVREPVPERQEKKDAYTIQCTMTEGQRADLIAFFKESGIKGTIRRER